MKLLLKSQGIKYDSIESLCLNDEAFLRIIMKKFDEIEFIKSFKYFGIDDKTKKHLKDFNSFKEHLKKIGAKTYLISDELDESTLTLEMSFEKNRMSFYLKKTVDKESITKFNDAFIRFFEILYELFEDKLVFDIVSSISILSIEYAEPRPPRVWKKFNPAGLVDFIILPKNKDDIEKNNKIIQSLCFGELLSSARRSNHNDKLFIVNWVNKVNSIPEISKIISDRIIWYYANSDFTINSRYNEKGDEMISVINSSTTKYLTFYSEFNHKGYKGMVINEIDDNTLKQIKKLSNWVEQGKTPDGYPLSEINLIVPSREQAINLTFLIKQFKLNSILYTDNEGKLWNPIPRGNWLN